MTGKSKALVCPALSVRLGIKDPEPLIGKSRASQGRIQDSEGGVSYIQKGGVSYRNFRSGSKLLQGPGQINKQKKIADSCRGVSDHPKKSPVSAHASCPCGRFPARVIHQVIIVTGPNKLYYDCACSRPGYGLIDANRASTN